MKSTQLKSEQKMELNDDGFEMQGKNGLFPHRPHIATFINYQLSRCLTTKEHGLVGM